MLPVDSIFFINYNQTMSMCGTRFVLIKTHNQIEKLSGITVSPSGIESTSLLLAHGIGKSPEDYLVD